MAERKSAKRSATSATRTASQGLTAEEKAAMRELVRERSSSATKAEEERAVVEKIAAMHPSDRAMAKRVHAIVKASAPILTPKLWYGMPAYAKDGKVVCFFQDAQKFKTRYATLGFSDQANLDDGPMWPNAYALTELTAAEEARIGALVKKAVR